MNSRVMARALVRPLPHSSFPDMEYLLVCTQIILIDAE
jgi:hypothetical protein